MAARITATDTKIRLITLAITLIDFSPRMFLRGMLFSLLDKQYGEYTGEPDRWSTYYRDFNRWDSF